jgi:hypothetical protein
VPPERVFWLSAVREHARMGLYHVLATMDGYGSPDSIWLYTERTFVPSLASCSPAFVSASPTRGGHQALLAFKFWPFWPF